MDISAIVIDDEPLARQRLSRLLGDLGVQVIATGDDGREAVALNARHQADIVFLDINMPIKNGLVAAQEIVSTNEQPPAIIFCTAYDEYALEAFNTDATAYILKPVNRDSLLEAINKAQRVNKVQVESWLAQQETNVNLVIKRGSVTESISSDQFVYFYVNDKHVYTKLIDHPEMLVDYTLKEIESLLGDQVIRIHRSCLVNKSYVEKMTRGDSSSTQLKLRHTDKEFDVSRRHLSEVKKCFQ